MTQNEQILEHLQKGNTITPLEALEMFGCFRLGARIYELKAQGHNIDSMMTEGENGKHFKQYWLVRLFEVSQEPIPSSEYHNYPKGGA